MPLSEHEQRLLDQIERALYDEDPKFASTVRSTDLRTHMRRRIIRAAFVFVLGLVLLPVGVLSKNSIVGILGFLIMIGALVLALSAYKRIGGPAAPSGQPRSPGGTDDPGARRQRGPRPAGGGWRARVDERWKRRWDERGNGER